MVRSVFVPTPHDVVEKMLGLAEVKKSDVVYDLGSGDGRIVIAAAKEYGSKSFGFEIDSDLVELSRENARKANVESITTFKEQDLFTVDVRAADVIVVYLLPKQLEALKPKLFNLRAGTRIVSHQFEIPGVKSEKSIKLESTEDGDQHTIYLYKTPLKKP